MTSVAKYLRTRAILKPWHIEGTERKDFSAAVVIPALGEAESLPATLASLAENEGEFLKRTLVVVVVNHGPEATPALQENNLRTLAMLVEGDARWRGLNLAHIDAATPGRELPAGEGVGLARKIGCDLALERLDWGGEPVLISLDADTLVRPDYLPALAAHFANSSAGGAVLPFCHRRGETAAQDAAIRLYELYLRHYVLGLQLAGSPYAFHTVGSALACRAGAYVAAGGMNRRRAAEDFYFLQQLAKTGGVAQVRGTVVYPAARISRRTPFGTGPAVERLARGEQAVRFHRADSFRLLKAWLQWVRSSAGAGAAEMLAGAAHLSPDLAGFLESCDFCDVWGRLQHNHKGADRFQNAFHDWFDGLKSRRLLHHLDECAGGRPDPEAALSSLLDWADIHSRRDVGAFLAALREHQIKGPY